MLRLAMIISTSCYLNVVPLLVYAGKTTLESVPPDPNLSSPEYRELRPSREQPLPVEGGWPGRDGPAARIYAIDCGHLTEESR